MFTERKSRPVQGVRPLDESQMAELEMWSARTGGAVQINRKNG